MILRSRKEEGLSVEEVEIRAEERGWKVDVVTFFLGSSTEPVGNSNFVLSFEFI